jgi:hypothetical protein
MNVLRFSVILCRDSCVRPIYAARLLLFVSSCNFPFRPLHVQFSNISMFHVSLYNQSFASLPSTPSISGTMERLVATACAKHQTGVWGGRPRSLTTLCVT